MDNKVMEFTLLIEERRFLKPDSNSDNNNRNRNNNDNQHNNFDDNNHHKSDLPQIQHQCNTLEPLEHMHKIIMCLLIKLNLHFNNDLSCFSVYVFDMRINNKPLKLKLKFLLNSASWELDEM